MGDAFQGWAAWHPEKGFGQTPHACGSIDDAIEDAECQTILDDDPAWKAVRVDVRRVIPPAWDAYHNRSYEPVELRAAEIYEGFEYDGPGQKPAWTPHGNGNKQDEARSLARKLLRDAGHVPTVSTEGGGVSKCPPITQSPFASRSPIRRPEPSSNREC